MTSKIILKVLLSRAYISFVSHRALVIHRVSGCFGIICGVSLRQLESPLSLFLEIVIQTLPLSQKFISAVSLSRNSGNFCYYLRCHTQLFCNFLCLTQHFSNFLCLTRQICNLLCLLQPFCNFLCLTQYFCNLVFQSASSFGDGCVRALSRVCVRQYKLQIRTNETVEISA
jgi:hypothetical protein